MQTIDCILTTLLVLASLWAVKRAYKFLWLDRVPREDYEDAMKWHDQASTFRQQLWDEERKHRDARESVERLEKRLTHLSSKVLMVRQSCVSDKMLTKFDSIMGMNPKV